jgi:hypothetical protein
MASLFAGLPSAAVRNQGRSTALVSASGSGGGSGGGSERGLQWVYDDETANCMHCNTPFTLITRKVGSAWRGRGTGGGGKPVLTLFPAVCVRCSTTAGDAGTSSATTARRTSVASHPATRS